MRKNKVLIILPIIVLLIIVIATILGFYIKNHSIKDIYSSDNNFKITMPNKIKYKSKDLVGETYSLELYSVKDEMFIYTTEINKLEDFEFENSVVNEKNTLTQNLSNVSIVSDVSEFNINDYNALKYCYTYTDENYNKDLYSEVVWIETDSKIYILDLEVIIKNQDKYIPLFEEIEKSFEEIK